MDGTRFDILARTFSAPCSRRTAVRTLTVAGLGLAWLGRDDAAEGKNKRKKGKKPRKPKAPKPPAEPDICDTTWPGEGNGGHRDHCKFMREQCPLNRALLGTFCIVNRTINNQIHKVADCCPADYSCCNGECINLDDDDRNCGSSCDNRKACGGDQFCSNGSCVQICQDRSCPPGQICHTSIGYLCNGQASTDCQCGCGPGNKHCPDVQGGICVSENSTFC